MSKIRQPIMSTWARGRGRVAYSVTGVEASTASPHALSPGEGRATLSPGSARRHSPRPFTREVHEPELSVRKLAIHYIASWSPPRLDPHAFTPQR
ncbi:hypothetical protein E2C01_067787 [Portunus trituberculatus]|uniref:Uncharacterized protein n=1 Tax=Portunus trituberculatus TaxID=210409 RepID=A0A5B7HXP9_PORTR|nr:hypothetical protein [Portunus trituberculatus]